MTHQVTSMTRVEDPTNRFSKAVGRVDNVGDMYHVNIAGLFLILNGKILNVDVARTFVRATGIDHFDGQFIVFQKRSSLGPV